MDASSTTATLPCQSVCQAPSIDRRSIYADCQNEAEQFKWILSERAGRDVGEEAIRQWVREHWWGYLRARWLEHLHGKCFWIELDHGDFGIIPSAAFQNQKPLLDQILDRLKDGQENLDIICWAVRSDPAIVDHVIEILIDLDINKRRLIHQFESVP